MHEEQGSMENPFALSGIHSTDREHIKKGVIINLLGSVVVQSELIESRCILLMVGI